MITGQLMVYRFNGLHNNRENVDRNIYALRDIRVQTKEEFQHSIAEALDEVAPGQGYVLVKWSGRTFICEKDTRRPRVPYVRHEIKYHPLLDKFTV